MFLWRNSPSCAQTVSFFRCLDHTQLDTRTHAHARARAHTHTHLVERFRTSDQLFAEAATYMTHNKHKERKFMSSAGNRERDPSNQTVADPRPRPHGHRNLPRYNKLLGNLCAKQSAWGDLHWWLLFVFQESRCFSPVYKAEPTVEL
jgi:hypothetical protein